MNLRDRSSAQSLDPPRLVHELLERAAATWPEKQALVVAEGVAGDGSRWSYRDLNHRSNQLARGLQLRGAAPGDRIALLAPNGVFYVTAYFAIVKAGCTAVPLSMAIDVATLLHQLAICRPRLLLVGARAERVIVDAGPRLAELPDLTAVVLASRMAAPALIRSGLTIDILDPWVAPSAPSCDNLDLTIASNGLATIIVGIVASLALQQHDRVLVVLPLSYVFGKSLLTMCVAVGATAVIENRFQYPKTALDTVDAEGCTGISGVPSTFAILAHRTELRSRELPTLRWLAQAGGGMSPALIRELVEMLPSARIYVMYGATEGSGRLACLPSEELASAIGSIGRAIEGVTLTVYRDDGQECDVGESGELFAMGDNIMAGYYGDVDATGAVLSERGYATGDLAYRDARSLLWLVGRKRDIFKVGGYRVSAREIEDAISEHPAISEAAVIGVPDEVLGDRLVAYVVPRGADGQPVDARNLQNFLRHRLAKHKIPVAIVGCAELPKNLAGKVMKNELLRQWNAGAWQQEILQPIGGDQDP